MVHLALLVVCLVFNLVSSSTFRCVEAPWEVDYDDGKAKMTAFQSWLNNWQESTERCTTHGSGHGSPYGVGGIGASLAYYAMRDFANSIIEGKVFRPLGGYLWADTNKEYCTNHVPSLDCYFQSLSTCTNTNASDVTFTPTMESLFPAEGINSMCILAKIAKKPMQWVMGQLIHYIIRPSPDLSYLINGRVAEVMKHKLPNTSMIAVQIRTGSPDQNRAVLSVDHYINAVDKKVADQVKSGHNVSLVYVMSQSNEHTFESIEAINKKYPRPYKIVFLPQYPLPDSHVKEVEHMLQEDNNTISRFHLMAEFMTDIELSTLADVYIGSKSTIYITTALLRYARNFKTVEYNTCFLHGPNELLCEGETMRTMQLWKFYFTDAFTGGSFRRLWESIDG